MTQFPCTYLNYPHNQGDTRMCRFLDEVSSLFYEMSEETGGNIYVIDKPSSTDEMLQFLKEKVTMGMILLSILLKSKRMCFENY